MQVLKVPKVPVDLLDQPDNGALLEMLEPQEVVVRLDQEALQEPLETLVPLVQLVSLGR